VPLIAASVRVVERIVSEISPLARRLMEHFWPGSLTILFEPARPMSGLIIGARDLIGIRVPPACVAGTLAGQTGGVITATSANLSGDPDPETIEMISSRVLDAVDLVVDMGRTPGGLPSTVVLPHGDKLRILRVGAISAEALAPFADLYRKDKSA
jgi:L-threonylcarbamoyladenylate synthase